MYQRSASLTGIRTFDNIENFIVRFTLFMFYSRIVQFPVVSFLLFLMVMSCQLAACMLHRFSVVRSFGDDYDKIINLVLYFKIC